jgi:hypothetical protein
VFAGGSSYVSQRDTNTAAPAVAVANNTGEWALLASQGGPGAATVSIGTVASGTTAAVSNSGTQNAAVLNFTLPKGDTGSTGAVGMTFLGAWSGSASYQPTTVVTYNGAAYFALVASIGVHPVGDANSANAWALLAAKGDAGVNGSAPSISVSATHTGAAGTSAIVKNVSTDASSILLDFTIPKGDTGAAGPTGPAGVSGSGGTQIFSSVHTVPNGTAQFHNPLMDARAGTESGATLGWLPATCNLASMQVYYFAPATASAQLTVRTGLPNGMSGGTACAVAANATTTCAGPGSLASGSFVSLNISTNATVTTYLYTQFSCN